MLTTHTDPEGVEFLTNLSTGANVYLSDGNTSAKVLYAGPLKSSKLCIAAAIPGYQKWEAIILTDKAYCVFKFLPDLSQSILTNVSDLIALITGYMEVEEIRKHGRKLH